RACSGRYTLSLHDALPIWAVLAAFGEAPDRSPLAPGETWAIAHVVQSDVGRVEAGAPCRFSADAYPGRPFAGEVDAAPGYVDPRSEEHTSELQSLAYLVCR